MHVGKGNRAESCTYVRTIKVKRRSITRQALAGLWLIINRHRKKNILLFNGASRVGRSRRYLGRAGRVENLNASSVVLFADKTPTIFHNGIPQRDDAGWKMSILLQFNGNICVC